MSASLFHGKESFNVISILIKFLVLVGENESDFFDKSSKSCLPLPFGFDLAFQLCDFKHNLSISQAALSLFIKLYIVH